MEEVSILTKLYLVFIDSFFAGLILPIRNESLIKAYVLNNTNGLFLACSISFFANVLGLYLNYLIGILFHIFSQKRNSSLTNGKFYVKVKSKFNSFFFIFLILSSYNIVGTFIPLIAGIVKYNYKKTLLLIAIGKLIMLTLLFI